MALYTQFGKLGILYYTAQPWKNIVKTSPGAALGRHFALAIGRSGKPLPYAVLIESRNG